MSHGSVYRPELVFAILGSRRAHNRWFSGSYMMSCQSEGSSEYHGFLARDAQVYQVCVCPFRGVCVESVQITGQS